MVIMLAIVACEVVISVDGVTNRVIVTSSSFNTNYEYAGQSVVCDDRSTRFEYEISYRGAAKRVEVDLVGRSGRVHNIRSFSPSRSNNERGHISDSFTVRSEVAPLSLDTNELSPQAIVVNPRAPQIIGYTTLVVDLHSEVEGSKITTLKSGNIPVLDFCG